MSKKIVEKIRSMWKMSDSPISSVEKRLAVIETTVRIFGWDTQRDNWKPGIRTLATTMIVLTSLACDIRRVSFMIENRKQEKIEDIVEAFVFIVTQSVCSYRIYLVIRHKEKQR